MAQLSQRGWEMAVQSIFVSPILSDLARTISSDYIQKYEAPANLISPDSECITPQMLPLFGLQEDSVKLNQADIDQIISLVPAGVQNVQDIYPLAPLQEGILFHHRLSDKGLYVTPTLLRIENEKSLSAFIYALQSVIDRHDILRTAILWEGLSQSVQVVYRKAILQIEHVMLLAEVDEQGAT